MSNRKISLPETKGAFQLSGAVLGTAKDKFYVEAVTKKNSKDMRSINFGVSTSPTSTSYLNLNGFIKDEVVFYKRPEKKGEKGVTKKIKWAYRESFKEEGFKLIGINVGLIKKINEKGKEVNDSKTFSEFDACKYISANLKDDTSVFVKGKLEFGHYTNTKDDSITRTKKFIPAQISLCKPVDFEDEKFEEVADFQQRIIFMSIEEDKTNLDDIKFLVSAKIVTYSSIEDTEFVIRDKGLATKLRKNLKPYTSIDVWGKISNKAETEEVEEEDTWGEENKMDKVSNTYIRELVITGADPKTIDKEVYTEANIEEAVRAIKEFGEGTTTSDGTWGSTTKNNDTKDDDEEPWG